MDATHAEQIRNTTSFATAEENEHLSALEQEKARLENAVKHLQRSNAELAVALAERGPDADFEQAVKEMLDGVNLEAVSMKKLRGDLEVKFGVPLTDKKSLIKEFAEKYIS